MKKLVLIAFGLLSGFGAMAQSATDAYDAVLANAGAIGKGVMAHGIVSLSASFIYELIRKILAAFSLYLS